MDIVDAVFDDLNKELFPGLDRVGRHAAMALAVKLSETRGNYSLPGVALENDPFASGTYKRLRKTVPSEFSEAALLAAGTRIRHFAAGNLAILLSVICPSLADKESKIHHSDEYGGIRDLYHSLRILAPNYWPDEVLQKMAVRESLLVNDDLVSYLINGSSRKVHA